MDPLTPVNQPRKPIQNHLVWAILTTLLCCLPFGIVSIIYASKVDTKVAAGDLLGAQSDSKNALTWAIVSACVAALGWLIYLVFFASMMAAIISSKGGY